MARTGSRVVLNLTGSDNMKHVEPGDAIAHLRSFQGGLETSALAGKVSTAYTVIEPLDGIDPDFYRWVFKSSAFVSALAAGVQQLRDGQSIRFADFAKVDLPRPPIDEQRRIADFLNDRVARLDWIIEARHAQMVLIVERVEGLIARELSPLSPLDAHQEKHSLRVPQSWSTPRLSYIVNIGSGSGITSEEIEPQGNFPVYGANGVRGFASSFTHANDRILVGRQGALCGNVTLAGGPFWASEHALVCEPLVPFDMNWMLEVLRSMNLRQYSRSAAQPGINASLVGSMRVPWVDIGHQQVLGQRSSAWHDGGATARKQGVQSVELLAEYKTSLITAAVKGELDVTTAGSNIPG